jgi:hypothetical protein
MSEPRKKSRQLAAVLEAVVPRLKLRLAQLELRPAQPEQDKILEQWL